MQPQKLLMGPARSDNKSIFIPKLLYQPSCQHPDSLVMGFDLRQNLTGQEGVLICPPQLPHDELTSRMPMWQRYQHYSHLSKCVWQKGSLQTGIRKGQAQPFVTDLKRRATINIQQTPKEKMSDQGLHTQMLQRSKLLHITHQRAPTLTIP